MTKQVMIKNGSQTISNILEKVILDKAYEIAYQIKEDLGLLDGMFFIRDTNDDNIIDENYISVQFSLLFKSKVGDKEKIEKELNSFDFDNYHFESEIINTDEGFELFYLDIDNEIVLSKSIIENKKQLMEMKGVIEYLSGKYSYNF